MKTVTTNWRTDEGTYANARAWAASLGMSVNEYISYVMQTVQRSEFLGLKPRIAKKRTQKDPYEPLWKLLKKPYERKPMGASEEDKIIYDI